MFSNANIRSVEIFLSFEHYLTVDFVCAFDLCFFLFTTMVFTLLLVIGLKKLFTGGSETSGFVSYLPDTDIFNMSSPLSMQLIIFISISSVVC